MKYGRSFNLKLLCVSSSVVRLGRKASPKGNLEVDDHHQDTKDDEKDVALQIEPIVVPWPDLFS